MWLIKMAWKNIWRNRQRTIVTMAAIFFATILSVLSQSFQDGIFDNLVKNVVGFYTGYVQVHHQGYWDEQILDNSMEAALPAEKILLANSNIRDITPRLESFALASSGDITRGCLVVGIDPLKENQVTSLKNKLVEGKYLEAGDQALLLSAGLSRRLKLTAGDTLVLIGQGYHGATAAGKYPIKGILKFGSPDLNDKSIFLPLVQAQDLYGAYGMITSYILSLKDTELLQETSRSVRAKLGTGYEVMTWEEMLPDIKQHIETDTNNTKYVQGILYMLICFGIFGTLLMMMVERTYELGMLVAIGMKKSKLTILLLIESLLTVVAGCFIGIAVSIPLVFYFNRHPIKMGGETAEIYERFGFEAIFPTSLDAGNFLSQGFTILVIGLLLSLYPVYKVWRLDVAVALKR